MNATIGKTFVPEKHKDFWKSRRYAAAYGNKDAQYLSKFDPLVEDIDKIWAQFERKMLPNQKVEVVTVNLGI